MDEIFPEWVKKRQFLWPVWWYAIIGWIIVQMIDMIPLAPERNLELTDLAMSVYFVGYFPAAAWSWWIYKKDRKDEDRDQGQTPGPRTSS
jgi:hypothetical protein